MCLLKQILPKQDFNMLGVCSLGTKALFYSGIVPTGLPPLVQTLFYSDTYRLVPNPSSPVPPARLVTRLISSRKNLGTRLGQAITACYKCETKPESQDCKMNSSVYVQNDLHLVSKWKSSLIHSKAYCEWECCQDLAHCNKELLIEWLSLERYSQNHPAMAKKSFTNDTEGKYCHGHHCSAKFTSPYLSNCLSSTRDTIESLYI